MKLKSLVIAYQNDAVNTFSDLVHTARHTTKVVSARNYLSQPFRRRVMKVRRMIGVKS